MLHSIKKIINFLLGLLLRLRYRITVSGLEDIKSDNRPILFLPNHPALIDPIIVMHSLYNRFMPRPLADEKQVSNMFIRPLMNMIGTIIIPDLTKGKRDDIEQVNAGLKAMADGLRQGKNILLYPGGRLMRSNQEDLGANSAVHALLNEVTDVRVVLIRTTGLWGSSFSRACGTPSLWRDFGKNVLRLASTLIVFMPRRKVRLQIQEAVDFPRSANRMAMNAFLEKFYNQEPLKNTSVPYYLWQGTTAQTLPEPAQQQKNGDTSDIPDATRQLVMEKLQDLAGVETLQEEDKLAADLGLDSLVLVEFGAWLGEEFGVAAEHLDGLETVSDCVLAAGGIVPDVQGNDLKAPSRAWFDGQSTEQPTFIEGKTIAELVVRQAIKRPGQVIMADQISGEKTYRQLITAIFALLPIITKIKGKRVGIMLPASVSAVVAYLAVMFAGKEPVLVNWTSGAGQVDYCLKKAKAETVITARAFTARLENQGFSPASIHVHWLNLEEVAKKISLPAKLKALFMGRLRVRSLLRNPIAENAAILFTSGSETYPKAVPLSHTNFLANGRDVLQVLSLQSQDRLLGVLPVFHSLGLAGTVILPLCSGLQTVYWPNPTEGAHLARMTEIYKTSVFITTPTFLQNMLRNAEDNQLQSMRLIFSGAEKCPTSLFTAMQERVPGAVICEGYGVTECSPVISVNSPQKTYPGTIGPVLPSMHACIVHHESGEPVADGETGRLLVSGPNVFSGYLDGNGSPFVEKDGKVYYDTGDLVVKDGHGCLSFVGRLKRFVKLGGEMISLPAIEQVLDDAFGNGEEPSLAVVPSGNEEHAELLLMTTQNISRSDVNTAIRNAGFSPLHNIRKILQIESLPLLGTGKIDYRQLQEKAVGLLQKTA